MRTPRRAITSISIAAIFAMGLSGCGVVDYYRGGLEDLTGYLSEGSRADAVLAELVDVLETDLGVERASVQSRAFAMPATAQLDVLMPASADAGTWRAVSTEITSLLDEHLDLDVEVVLRDARVSIAYPLSVDSVEQVVAVAAIRDAWGVAFDAVITTPPAPTQLTVSARSDDDLNVTAAFVRAAPALRAISDGFVVPVRWDLPGYAGAGVAPDDVLPLMLDPGLPIAPTVRYDEVDAGYWPSEFVGLMHHADGNGAGFSTVHVQLDVGERFEDARGWPAFVALVRRGIAEVDSSAAFAVSWVTGVGESAGSAAGGIRIPTDGCVPDEESPVSGLSREDEAVAEALVRAGIDAAAFSVGSHCSTSA